MTAAKCKECGKPMDEQYEFCSIECACYHGSFDVCLGQVPLGWPTWKAVRNALGKSQTELRAMGLKQIRHALRERCHG